MKNFLGLLGAAALFGVVPAHAAPYVFTLTGSDDTAVFTLNSSPTPSYVVSSSGYFDIDGVQGVYSGDGSGPKGDNSGPISVADIQFYNSANGGGFEVNDPNSAFGVDYGVFSLDGAQLFSGTLNQPTFIPGTYTFTEDYFYGPVNEKLTITAVSAVPLPASLPLFGTALLGLAGLGYVVRRERATLGEAGARAQA